MDNLQKTLRATYHFDDFKPGQEETIQSVLHRPRTLSILPTGTGKTLCYQMAGRILGGHTIIISPLLSLMEDQVVQLKKQGEKEVVAINSNMSHEEKIWTLNHIQRFDFIFFSPEMIMQDAVKQALRQLSVTLFVVDEAHCISQWGIDFRPEYERLHELIKENKWATVLALTATATPKVKQDIVEKLFVQEETNVIQYSINRPNIYYQVAIVEDKLAYVLDFVQHVEGPGILYFSSKKEAERVTNELSQKTDVRVAFYHGGLSNQERAMIQQQFIANEIDVLCATNAFGMGINKPDIRYVLHYHLPSSIEAYVQESGRAGRDGQQSLSVLLYQTGDEHIHYYFQQEIEENRQFLEGIRQQNRSQLNQLLPLLTDIQKKWVEGIVVGRYKISELEDELQRKKQEKDEQLTQVLHYIYTKECRRVFLLHYFQEDNEPVPIDKCCDFCGVHDKILQERRVENRKQVEMSNPWQIKLKNLFNMPN